jgi:hypothetical protein
MSESKHESTPLTGGAALNVTFSGAVEFFRHEKGSEARIYATFEQAIRRGVNPHVAAAVFSHAPGGGCYADLSTGPVVFCVSDGCTSKCHLYSVPDNWKPGDPIQPESDPAMVVTGRIYFCLCRI